MWLNYSKECKPPVRIWAGGRSIGFTVTFGQVAAGCKKVYSPGAQNNGPRGHCHTCLKNPPDAGTPRPWKSPPMLAALRADWPPSA